MAQLEGPQGVQEDVTDVGKVGWSAGGRQGDTGWWQWWHLVSSIQAPSWGTHQIAMAEGPSQRILRQLGTQHNSRHMEVIHGIPIVVSAQPHHMAHICRWKIHYHADPRGIGYTQAKGAADHSVPAMAKDERTVAQSLEW